MKKALLFCFVLLICPLFLRAQVANNTALVGTIVDPSGAPLSGATVTAVNEGTKVTYPGATNAEGYYSITFIVPGTYDVTVEQAGFTKLTKTGRTVAINEALRTDFKLEVGSTTTSVTVSATSPPIATDDATLGETFNTKAVEDLPLMGHNALDVAATASNVIIGPTSSYSGVPPGEDFIGAGQREIQNSLNLDGVSIMNNLISLAPARPGTDMISEVQMQSGNYSAQYGSYLGLHINLISKSGTNDLHGAAYDYIQNTALNAAPFLNPAGSPKPIQHYNQYGFDLGGPVYIPKLYNGRNKTFFFASYEKINQIQQATPGPTSTLTPAMEAGDFSGLNAKLTDPYTGLPYPNNQIPVSELNTPAAQISKNIEQYIAAPNLPGVTNNLNVNIPNNLFIHQTLDRVDENIGEHVRLFVRYHWQNLSIVGGDPFPTDASYGPTNTRNTAIGYTHIITPNLVNDFRIGLNTVTSDNLNYFAQNGLTDAGTKLGIPGFNSDTIYHNPGIPSINFDTYHEAGNDASNWYQDDRTVDGYDQVSWTHGKHNIMAGAELRRLTLGRQATNSPRGSFSFNGAGPTCVPSGKAPPCVAPDVPEYTSTGYGAADFVLGLAQTSQTPVLPVKGSVGEWRDGFFVLDNWQPFRNLTLNYGLRYELPTVPYSLNGYARILNAGETALIPVSNASNAASFTPNPGFKFNDPNHNNWAPRIGFAYRATDRTTIRGGFGIYYNANQLNSYTLATQNYPLSASTSYFTTPGNLVSLASPTAGAPSGAKVAGTPGTFVSAVTMGPHLPTQTLYQWNLSWGQDLWNGAGAELQYLGSHAVHLDRDFYDNQPLLPSTNTNINANRPNQLFGTIRRIQNDEYSHYNGLTAILRQRAAHGLSGMLSYTWSHDLDITDNSNGATTTMDQYNIGRDYGNSNWDIRNRFVGTVTYELPNLPHANAIMRQALGGWQTNAIVTLQSGEPFNVNLGFDNANVGLPRGNVQRPNVLHKAFANCSLHDYIKNNGYHGGGTSCIDPTAFVVPDAGTYGNSGRNSIHGPGYSNVNFSIFKNFNIWENLKFQFRAEAGNLFNHPSAGNPNSQMVLKFNPSDPVGTSNFGTVTTTSTFYHPRSIQLAGKIIF